MQGTRADISALTGLRGVAALSVVVYHLWEMFGSPKLLLGSLAFAPVFANCFYGVDIFFVLSGFLIGRPFVRAAQTRTPMPPFLPYLWRRVRRLVPAYWANLIILFVVLTIATGTPPLGAVSLLAHLGFLFWYTLPYGALPFNPVWWTLPIEWWAYFALPALTLGLRQMHVWLWLALILAVVLWTRVEFVNHFYAGDQGFWWQAPDYRNLRARFDQFAIGLVAAWYFERGLSQHQARVVGWIGLAGFAAVFVYVGWFVPRWLFEATRPWMFVHYTAVAAPIALIVLASASGWRPLARCFESRALMVAGTMSYSLYLWHYPVFVYVFRHAPTSDWPLAWRVVPALALAAVVTWIAYRCFERPFLAPRARDGSGVPAASQSTHA